MLGAVPVLRGLHAAFQQGQLGPAPRPLPVDGELDGEAQSFGDVAGVEDQVSAALKFSSSVTMRRTHTSEVANFQRQEPLRAR